MTKEQIKIAKTMLRDIEHFADKVDKYHNHADVKSLHLLVKTYETYWYTIKDK